MSEDSEPMRAEALTDSDMNLDSRMATVLAVIDKLRDRKARPDLERIFVMASRQQPSSAGCSSELTRDAVSSILQQLVEQRQVMRVEYKGSVSYRNVNSWHRRKELASGRNSPTTSHRVLTAAQSLPDGAIFTAQLLHTRMLQQQQADSPPMSATALSEALEREAAAGRLFRLGPSRFQLDLDGTRRQAALRRRKERVQLAKRRRAAAAAVAAADVADADDDADRNDCGDDRDVVKFASPPPSKRAAAGGPTTPLDLRLRSPRRRRRKISPLAAPRDASASASSSSMDTAAAAAAAAVSAPADLCDFCQSPPSANRMGVPERMLRCRDCAHKAHPSCMLYGPELATRACQSPWQCSECKTCCVCSGSGDPELILICDACDKGYHVSCHRPSVTERPASDAKWVCSRCRDEERAAGSAQQPQLEQKLQQPHAGDASQWSIAQVRCWLDNEGFPLAAQAFVEQEIDGASLMLMKRMDVLTGLGLKLGPAVKVFEKISRLQGRCRTLLQVKQCGN